MRVTPVSRHDYLQHRFHPPRASEPPINDTLVFEGLTCEGPSLRRDKEAFDS